MVSKYHDLDTDEPTEEARKLAKTNAGAYTLAKLEAQRDLLAKLIREARPLIESSNDSVLKHWVDQALSSLDE